MTTGAELLRIVSERDALLVAAIAVRQHHWPTGGERSEERDAWDALRKAVDACLGTIDARNLR